MMPYRLLATFKLFKYLVTLVITDTNPCISDYDFNARARLRHPNRIDPLSV